MGLTRPAPIWLVTVSVAAFGLGLAWAGDVLPADPGFGLPRGEPALAATALEAARSALDAFLSWLRDSYARAPALVLGLVLLVAAPVVALAGLAARAASADHERTVLVRRPSGASQPGAAATGAVPEPAWSANAWIEVEGRPERRWKVGHGLVRVGREDDNEIRFSARTVHRYHAVIHRTADHDYVVTDLSGGGNGVLVNGRQIVEARLADGDRIGIGGETLRFRFTRG